jgi:tRNA threonylcarbamoyladenosine biosynthesis protein TsaB
MAAVTELLLVIDTATREGVVGLADGDGNLVASESWTTGHRHGEELLSRLDLALVSLGASAPAIRWIAVGIGPGSFTGLRIGLATAKTLAYGLGVPLVGVSTTHALALAADMPNREVVVALPAGAHDRYLAHLAVNRDHVAELLPASLAVSLSAEVAASEQVPLIAVDLAEPEVPATAVLLGQRAVRRLPSALARLGAVAIAAGRHDDVAQLVPAYVALPRGITQAAASVEWSPDLR